MKRISRSSGQRGSMMVELALVMPVLVLVGLLGLEGSQLVRTHQVLNNAAREGARLSVLPENRGRTADLATQVINYAGQNGITLPGGNVAIDQTILVPMPTGVSMSASNVTVNYTYTLRYLAAFTWLGVPGTYTLQGSAQFRNFY